MQPERRPSAASAGSWVPPPGEIGGEGVGLGRPGASRAPREGGEVYQAPEDAEAEPVQDLVRILHPAAGLRDEEAPRPPDAVAVDGEDLAGLLAGGLRPAQDAPRVACGVQGVAAQVLVHQVLVGLRRSTADDSEREPGLGGRSCDRSEHHHPLVALGLHTEPGLAREHRRALQTGEEPPREPPCPVLGLLHGGQGRVRLLPVAAQAREGALLEPHAAP